MPANSWKLAPGLNNVGSFQVSGRPYTSGSCLAPASGSALVIRFPTVTKWFQIEPHSSMEDRELRVAFSEQGLYGKGSSVAGGGYNYKVHASSSLKGPNDLKVSELWFMSENASNTATFDILAGLTNVQISSLYTADRTINGVVEASGPNWSGSIGVG